MEGAEEIQKTPLENQDLDFNFLHQTVGVFVAEYGWYLLLMTVCLYMLIQHLVNKRDSQSSSASEPVQDPISVAARLEALAASRQKMQDELDAKAALFREKQQQLEEEKRRQKIEMWENMKQGKSTKGNSKIAQSTEEASTSTSTLKPKTEKKALRKSGYNPLSGGGGGGSCAWRPGRRGPSSGG
ncbi:selenoprotein S [Osmerus mordax]|uniref:Selenoprotein S n=1 Tax=Osmerus mordax TaxID=8014 RepID=C1BLQ4_OSMMO|nr:Selenoprotein S [Osmerus mordax]